VSGRFENVNVVVCVWFDLHATFFTTVIFSEKIVFNILLLLKSKYNFFVKRVCLSILHAKLQGSGKLKIIYGNIGRRAK
jgi:hypothetical protein